MCSALWFTGIAATFSVTSVPGHGARLVGKGKPLSTDAATFSVAPPAVHTTSQSIPRSLPLEVSFVQ
jgi:hypothetical protein